MTAGGLEDRKPGGIYLDYASMGIVPPRALGRIAAAMGDLAHPRPGQTGTERTFVLVDYVEQARAAAARLLGVPARNVALIENTTHGLGLLAAGLAAAGTLGPSDTVALPDLEFISSALVWRRAQQRIGFGLRAVPTRHGCVDVEALVRAVDAGARVVVAAAVQEVSGDRLDDAAASALAGAVHARGGFLILDGIQEAGVRARDLVGSGVDAYVVGGHKWLGSPFGLGFMYVSDRLLAACEPVFDGYFGLLEPAGGWEAYLQDRHRHPLDKHPVTAEARKFESGGMPNFVGAVGLAAAIEEVEDHTLAAIERHVLDLNRRLRENLAAIGGPGLPLAEGILGGSTPRNHAGIVTLSLPGGLTQERALLAWLRRHGVACSLRSIAGVGGIRLSFYTPTTAADIDRCCELIEGFVRNG